MVETSFHIYLMWIKWIRGADSDWEAYETTWPHHNSLIQVDELQKTHPNQSCYKGENNAASAIGMLSFVVKSGKLTQQSIADFLLELAASGQKRNVSFCHVLLPSLFSSGGWPWPSKCTLKKPEIYNTNKSDLFSDITSNTKHLSYYA